MNNNSNGPEEIINYLELVKLRHLITHFKIGAQNLMFTILYFI